MYSIGEISKVTGLSIKTLRFYHDKGLIIPAAVDPQTGYRFYDDSCLDKARIVIELRRFEFSIEEVAEIVSHNDDEADILDHLRRQKQRIADRIRQQRDVSALIDRIVERETQARQALEDAGFEVTEKHLDPLLVGGIPLTGRYSDCGPAFGTLGRRLGRHATGKPLCLYYDGEYRDGDARFEPCLPLRREVEADGIQVRELPACRCVSLVHRGPYSALGRSYGKAFAHARKLGLPIQLPTREIYLKGPGMIFKGNPQKYLTEIQLPIEEQ